ncbi:MAG: hypothetical protein AAB858_02300, partial [Patescibacteria group bacterium]
MCKKVVVSMYSEERKDLIVYCNACWWSDKWHGNEYAQEYDPSRPFFEQMKELICRTPQVSLAVNYPTLVNSEYVNHTATAKDSYLIYTADYCENVLYSEILLHAKDSMDCSMFGDGELCYELINSGRSYRTFFSEDCDSCTDVYFSKDCIGCSDCFGCTGLRKKKYHIFNKPYSKEAYQKELDKFNLDSYQCIQGTLVTARNAWLSYPRKFVNELINVNVTGEYIYESRNSRNMYIVHKGAEDCRYCQILTMPTIKDAYDYTSWGNNAQHIYECMIVGEGANAIKFSYQTWPNVRDLEYCVSTLGSSYMFGCANIRNKKYCILNKEYSPEEYTTLRERIIEEMKSLPFLSKTGATYSYGEFLPPDLSLFAYNESYAMQFFPLSREETEAKGLGWYEAPPSLYQITMRADELPDSIKDVPDSITGEIIECGTCRRPFRIISAEVVLLRRFNLPLPRACPNCRSKARWGRANPPHLWKRGCQCSGATSSNAIYQNTATHAHGTEPCKVEFETSYAP